MNDMIIFILVFSSLSILLAKGEIFDPIKEIILKHIPSFIDEYVATLLTCSMCIGFWIGLIGSFIYDMTWLQLVSGKIQSHLLAGPLISVTSIAIDKFIFKDIDID